MLSIRKTEHIGYEADKTVERMEIDVDSATELPANGEFNGMKIYQGSIAFAIEDKAFYAMTSGGDWIKQNGSDDSSDANAINFVTTNLTDVKQPNANLFEGLTDVLGDNPDVLTTKTGEPMEEIDGNTLVSPESEVRADDEFVRDTESNENWVLE